MVPVVCGEVLQGEAEDGEEQVEEVAHAQEQQQHVERPEALLLSGGREGDFEGESVMISRQHLGRERGLAQNTMNFQWVLEFSKYFKSVPPAVKDIKESPRYFADIA